MPGKREKLLEVAAADSPNDFLEFIQQHVRSPSSLPDDCFSKRLQQGIYNKEPTIWEIL